MITTRREVNIENGGTAIGRTVRRIEADERTVSINPEIEVRPTPFAATATATATAGANTTRITPQLDFDDLMPVIESDEKQENREEENRRLSGKAKVVLGVYLAAALILALIVLATGFAITGANREVAALENEIGARNAVLAESEALLTHVSDDVTITGAATELGMVKAESATAIELFEVGAVEEYTARTNAFDRLCDFLSRIIA